MRQCTSSDQFERFRVEPWVDWLGGLVARFPRVGRRLADWETRFLARETEGSQITAPIYISGLARSGSTILLECLAGHPETVTHRYRDFPGVIAPVLWDRISARFYAHSSTPVERAHGDGIAVTPDSPEAIEEMLWMAFYPQSHEPACDNRIGQAVAPDFVDFYRAHIRKLLWLRQGRRYLSKGNYNLVRLRALIEIFPDARIIIPLRDPITHIASLMRQHALFSAAETAHPAALRYMQRVGHFEFGLDRRPLNVGDAAVTAAVQDHWHHGREVEGWSLYWANLHDYLAEQLGEDASLAKAALLVRFEDLCADPHGVLQRILSHARLSADDGWLAAMAQRIRAPSYAPSLAEAERWTIKEITASAAQRLGYANSAS